VARPGGHEWTKFEMHTLLCLICRNIHIRGLSVPQDEKQRTAMAAGGRNRKSKKARELPHVSKKSAHMDVATALNRALNGRDISNDIDYHEVSAMIDKILSEKKGAIAVMQRQKTERMTRFMKQIWKRGTGFTGDKEEWNAGRKEEVEGLEKKRVEGTFTIAMGDVGDGLGGKFCCDLIVRRLH